MLIFFNLNYLLTFIPYVNKNEAFHIRPRFVLTISSYPFTAVLFFQLIRNTSSVNHITTAYIFNWGTKYMYKSCKWPHCEKPHPCENVNFKPYWYFHHIFNFRLENKETSEPRANRCTIIKSF